MPRNKVSSLRDGNGEKKRKRLGDENHRNRCSNKPATISGESDSNPLSSADDGVEVVVVPEPRFISINELAHLDLPPVLDLFDAIYMHRTSQCTFLPSTF